MNKRVLAVNQMKAFEAHLAAEERSPVTIEKYMRDIRRFQEFASGTKVDKELVVAYKKDLIDQGYAVRSINSMLCALNTFFTFLGWQDCCAKNLRQQKQLYCPVEKELQKSEYMRLLSAAENNPRLHMILQTICGTGIRISELAYFTVEHVKKGEVVVSCKNKTRVILIPQKLRRRLLSYSRERGIREGVIFRTRTGRPVDRSNVWAEMKKLCARANVNPRKVFPHNLRKLFARTFYRMEKDIAKLADILGHTSIDTTRIYIMSTAFEHQKKIEQLGLVM